MRIRPAIEGKDQIRDLAAQRSERLVCQHFGPPHAGGECGEHGSAALAGDVGSYRRELDVHRLQQTPDTIDHAVAVLLDVHAHACQFAQLPQPD